MHSSPRPPRGNALFGLIAILVVLAIILYLAFGNLGGTSYTQQVAQTKSNARDLAVRLNTQQWSILIAQYRQAHDKLPASAADLEQALSDPWGNAVTFTFEEDRRSGRTRVTYRSNGRDGEAGTEDDIAQTEDLPF